MNDYLHYGSWLIINLLAVFCAYKLTVIDSSNDALDKLTSTSFRKGMHTASIERLFYAMILTAIAMLGVAAAYFA